MNRFYRLVAILTCALVVVSMLACSLPGLGGGGKSTVTNTPVPTLALTVTSVPAKIPAPTVALTETLVPTVAPTNTPVPTLAPMATSVPTKTPAPTVALTETPVPTVAPTNTAVPTLAPTETPVPTVAPTNTPVPTLAPAPTQPPISGGETIVYITTTGSKYHQDGCRYLSKSKIPVSCADAIAQGYEPCGVCKPSCS